MLLNTVLMTLLRSLMFPLLLGTLACGQAQPRPLTRPNVQEAVSRCLRFFQDHKHKVAPDAYLVYQFLMERHGLPDIGSQSAFLDTLQLDTLMHNAFQPFLSLMEPTAFNPNFLISAEGTDPIMIAGLWYDRIPNKELLNTSIRSMDWDDGYMITHALLARTVAQQQFNAPEDESLDTMLFQCTLSLIEAKRPLWGDLELEALAFAQFADSAFDTPPSYLDEVIALQNDDGSWSNQGDTRGIPDHHTTVLALWALLHHAPAEYPNSGRPFVLR